MTPEQLHARAVAYEECAALLCTNWTHDKKAARAKKNRSAAKFWTEQKVRYSHMGEFIVGGAPLKVTITRIAPGKLDDDNLTGSAKHVRDGIADALGIDDGDPRITWVVEQAKFTGAHRGGYSCAVRIEVRE